MVKLSDGREISFDWHAISQKEWRLLLDVKTDYEAYCAGNVGRLSRAG